MAGPPEEKVAVVTGAASGIGLGIAERLARDGASVALFDLDGEEAERAAAKIRGDGGRAIALRVDVADRDAVTSGVDAVREHFGPVTILVNNAGKEGFRRFLDITPDTWNEILAINLTGTFHCCQLVLPDMIEAGWGRIVNLGLSPHGGSGVTV